MPGDEFGLTSGAPNFEKSIIPPLVEVEATSARVKMESIVLGSQYLVTQEIEKLIESEEEISRDDFVTSLLFCCDVFDDIIYLLAKTNVFPECCSMEEEALALEKLLNEEPADPEKYHEILSVLYGFLESDYEDHIQVFHKQHDGLTVFITDDGRIAIGKYLE